MQNILIFGSSGAIGNAFYDAVSKQHPSAHIHCFSRNPNPICGIPHTIDYTDENSIKSGIDAAFEYGSFDMVFVATGILHNDTISPEKSLKDLSFDKFHQLFLANTATPAMIAKYALPKLNRNSKSVFAAISARVGSISDNALGGWYAYRASKSALNMAIKTASIEIARNNKNAVIVGLHPGTVDSNLSKPFQKNVPDGSLFTPQYSSTQLLHVMESLSPNDTGKCFDYKGAEIHP